MKRRAEQPGSSRRVGLVGRDGVREGYGRPRRRGVWVELLEDRRLLATLNISSGALTYTAASTSGSALTISVYPSDPSDVELSDSVQASINLGAGAIVAGWTNLTTTEVVGPATSFSSVDITGATTAGQDLTLDYTTGDPLPASGLTFTPTAAIGNATNGLTITPGTGSFSFLNDSYAATGAGAGTITYSDTAQSNVPVTFSNLSPVTDTVPSPSFIFFAPAAATTVNVVDGPAGTTQINDGGTGAFELINFASKTTATVDVNNAGATTTVDTTTASAGLTQLFVNSGAGTDTIQVQATPSGVTTTTDTGSVSGSTTAIGLNGLLTSILGPLVVQSTGGANTLTVDDSLETTPTSYTLDNSVITATSLPTTITLSGAGISTLNLDSSGGSTVNLSALAQGGVTTYNFTGGTSLGANTLNIHSGQTALTYSTAGTLGFGAGQPTVNYTNFATINVTKPATPPAGTAATVTGTAGQLLTNVVVATFTESDLANTNNGIVASINWGDGASTAGTITATGSGSFEVTGSHTYAASGTYTVAVTVTDLGTSGSATVGGTTINVTSNGPVSSIPNPITSSANIATSTLTAQGATVAGQAGIALNPSAGGTVLVATFVDNGTPGAPSEYTASINWGDGTTTAGTITSQGTPNGVVFSVLGNHTYAGIGVYPVTVTIVKTATGATAIASGQADIGAAGLTAGSPVALTATSGTTLTAVVVGSFTDANTGAAATDFTATIDWGDGSPTSLGTIVAGATAGSFNVEGTHAYARPGSYATRIVVNGTGGATVPLTGTASVTDPTLTGTAAPVAAVEAKDTGMIVLATITDPNPLATAADLSATVNWGDGTGTSPAVVTLIGGTSTTTLFQITGSHTYAAAGSDTVSIAVTTTGGATTTPTPLTTTATVAAAPLNAAGTTIRGIEGIALNPAAGGDVLVATFMDTGTPDPAASYTATIDWGDGSTSADTRITAQGTPNGTVYSVFGNHTYDAVGTFQVTVTITKPPATGSGEPAPGAVTVASSQAVIIPRLIADAPPTVTTPERTLFSGPVGEFTDPNPTGTPSVFSALIDWGDGSPESAGIITLVSSTATSTTFLISGTHSYADLYGTPTATSAAQTSSTFPMSIHVVGTDGSSINLANTATVTGGPFTVSGRLDPSSDSGSSNSDDITNVVQPLFDGTSGEPFARVYVFAAPVGTTNPTAGTLLGTTTAGSTGAWSLTSGIALADGGYTITALAIDATNNTITNTATVVPDLVIDTVGPKVTSLAFERFQGQIVVTYQDLGGVNNAGVGLNMASVIDASNYQLISVHHPRVGEYRMNVLSDVPGTTNGTQTVTLSVNGGHYVRGGWYFFTIRSASPENTGGVRDIAGNALDGEFYGYFPSGNNIPGGNFVAQLTAIHHTIYAPSTVVGRGSPVSPPGTREHSVYVRATDNPSKFPRITATANRPQAARQAVKRVQHSEQAVSHPIQRVGRTTVATSTPKSSQPIAMGALDQALDQLGASSKHRKS